MVYKIATLKFERMVKFFNIFVAKSRHLLNGFGKDASYLLFPLLNRPSFITLLKLKPANQVQLEVRTNYIILSSTFLALIFDMVSS